MLAPVKGCAPLKTRVHPCAGGVKRRERRMLICSHGPVYPGPDPDRNGSRPDPSEDPDPRRRLADEYLRTLGALTSDEIALLELAGADPARENEALRVRMETARRRARLFDAGGADA